MSKMQVTILGAGLAGCEAALWLAAQGVEVALYEQKPVRFSPAHKSANFAELICSNSLKAERLDSASGLLKAEMRQMGSRLLQAAEVARVAAGGALAVDRDVFSAEVTHMVEAEPNITVHREEATQIDESAPVLVATGPLTEGRLAEQIASLTGSEEMHFYDAVAPIVTAESLDYDKVFAASRYGRGDADYLNCPFNKAEYEAFYAALATAERAPLHDFDQGAEQTGAGSAVQTAAISVEQTSENSAAHVTDNSVPPEAEEKLSSVRHGTEHICAANVSTALTAHGDAFEADAASSSSAAAPASADPASAEAAAASSAKPAKDGGLTVYEGCMPIEVMAGRGADTMRYGPLRPVGLTDPRTGHRPWANVQLRAENKERTLYNIVGFQTNLKWGEQKRVFSMIPGLEHAEFIRYGVMHRNTFLDSPKVLSQELCLKQHPNVFFAGQITGFEGYMESAACGLLAARAIYARLCGTQLPAPPADTMCGALVRYITAENKNFQPMGANMGILPPLEQRPRDKRERYMAVAERAVASFAGWIQATEKNKTE
jgi:folate-dependent tRNA-U54 methylase TrmFO/GidA